MYRTQNGNAIPKPKKMYWGKPLGTMNLNKFGLAKSANCHQIGSTGDANGHTYVAWKSKCFQIFHTIVETVHCIHIQHRQMNKLLGIMFAFASTPGQLAR